MAFVMRWAAWPPVGRKIMGQPAPTGRRHAGTYLQPPPSIGKFVEGPRVRPIHRRRGRRILSRNDTGVILCLVKVRQPLVRRGARLCSAQQMLCVLINFSTLRAPHHAMDGRKNSAASRGEAITTHERTDRFRHPIAFKGSPPLEVYLRTLLLPHLLMFGGLKELPLDCAVRLPGP